MKDKFFHVPMVTKNTSEGSVEFPILYKDASCVTAFFLCDLDKVKDQLKDVPLNPGLVIGNKAVVGLQCYEYRDTTVGVYNEVGVGIPVVKQNEKPSLFALIDLYRNPKKRKTGFYVIDLPVTTAAACAAGREMWGFPKFITEIPMTLSGRRLDVSVKCPDKLGSTNTSDSIFSFKGKMGLGLPSPPLSLKLYSYLNSEELDTAVNVRHGASLRSTGSVKISIGNSSHPMANRLRALDLNGKSPLALMSTTNFQSRLNLGIRTQ